MLINYFCYIWWEIFRGKIQNQNIELLTEIDVIELLGKKQPYMMPKKYGVSKPILNYPAKYNKMAIFGSIENGSVNRRAV